MCVCVCVCVCVCTYIYRGFPGGASGKESARQCRRYKRRGFNPCFRKIPWNRKWQPTPVFLPGKSHGQRNLVGYSPWGCKELDTTEEACNIDVYVFIHISTYIYTIRVKIYTCNFFLSPERTLFTHNSAQTLPQN